MKKLEYTNRAIYFSAAAEKSKSSTISLQKYQLKENVKNSLEKRNIQYSDIEIHYHLVNSGDASFNFPVAYVIFNDRQYKLLKLMHHKHYEEFFLEPDE